MNQLLTVRGPLPLQPYYEYQYALIVATRAPTAEQREWLVERVDSTRPAADAKFLLREARVCVRLYEALGRSDRLDAHRQDVHAILRAAWVGERDDVDARVRRGALP